MASQTVTRVVCFLPMPCVSRGNVGIAEPSLVAMRTILLRA